MENLSVLNTKCLANMPMLLDSVCQTLTKLVMTLSPYYDSLEKELNSAGYNTNTLNKWWERETIYVLGHDGGYKTQYLDINSITPKIELRNILPFEKKIKRNLLEFEINFGYICDESQNVIYFQLIENSETTFIKDLLSSKGFKKSKSSSQEYQYGDFEDNKGVWVEFTVDETLSLEKIETCSELFKTNILMPILNQLI